MTRRSWDACALAALHHGLVSQILPDIRSAGARDAMQGALRIVARLRAECEIGPEIAAAQLARWHDIQSRAQSVLPNVATPFKTDGLSSKNNAYTELCDELENTRRALNEAVQNERTLGQLLDAESPQAVWFRETTLALQDWLELFEAQLPTHDSHEITLPDPCHEEYRVALSRYLAKRFEGLPEDCVRRLRVVPGGRSKNTAIFELAPNSILPQRLVIRRDINAGGLTKTSVAAEFPLLRLLHTRGVPVPVPVLAEADAQLLNGSFMITEEVIDATKGGEPFAELIDMEGLDPSFPYDLAHSLARQHSIDEWPGDSALGGYMSDTGDSTERVRQFFTLWTRTTKPPMALATDLGFAWLLSHPIERVRPRRLVHGDLGMHNIMLRQGRFAAILDWELAHLGDPAEDIGNVRAALLQHLIKWSDFVNAYVSAGGDPAACDLDAVMYHSIWAHVRGSVYVALMREMVLNDGRTDLEYASIGADFFARTQHYIARELRLVQEIE